MRDKTIVLEKLDANVFRKLKIFEGLSASELQNLAARMRPLRIKRSQTIVVEGLPANDLYVLLSGVVKVSATNAATRAVLMGVVVAGEIFGLHSLLRDPVHQFRCDAFTDCVVGRIQAREFCEAVARVPFDRFKNIIEMSLGRWWWGLPVWYSRMTRLSVRDRTMALLLELSRKFGVADSRGMIINLPLRGGDLAELIGASRQTVSLEIEDPVRRGKVIRDGRRLLLARSTQSEQRRVPGRAALKSSDRATRNHSR
jgi:CRP/FNR family cyclic AMP-dependent transcriptional regulator